MTTNSRNDDCNSNGNGSLLHSIIVSTTSSGGNDVSVVTAWYDHNDGNGVLHITCTGSMVSDIIALSSSSITSTPIPTSLGWTTRLPSTPTTAAIATAIPTMDDLILVVASGDGQIWRIVPQLLQVPVQTLPRVVRPIAMTAVTTATTVTHSTTNATLTRDDTGATAIMIDEPFDDSDDNTDHTIPVITHPHSNYDHRHALSSVSSLSALESLENKHIDMSSSSSINKRRATTSPVADMSTSLSSSSTNKRTRVSMTDTASIASSNHFDGVHHSSLACHIAALHHASPIATWPPLTASSSSSPLILLRVPPSSSSLSLSSTPANDHHNYNNGNINDIPMISSSMATILFGASHHTRRYDPYGKLVILHGGMDGHIRWMIINNTDSSSVS
jgi:hypothetical protein